MDIKKGNDMKRFEDFVEGLNEDLVVPDLVDEKFEEALNMVESKEKQHWGTGVKVAAAALAVVVSGGVFGVTNPAVASKIPVIGHIFERVEQKAVYPGEYANKQTLSEKDQTDEKLVAEDQNIKLTASEVYSDGLSVYVSLKAESEKYDFSKIEKMSEDNAQVVQLMTSWKFDEPLSEKEQDFDLLLSGENDGNHAFIGIVKFDREEISNQGGTVNLRIKGIGLEQNQELKMVDGTWELEIPFTVDEDAGKEIVVDEKIDQKFAVKKVFVSPYQVCVLSDVPYTMPYANMTDDEIIAEGFGKEGKTYSDSEKASLCDEVRKAKEYQYYEMAVFNQDGEKIQFQEVGDTDETLQKDFFSVNGKKISRLHIYVTENEDQMFELIKAKTEEQAKKISEHDFVVDVK